MEVMAVYPGRFHPFHRGHASSFNQIANKFGIEHALLAISGKQEQPKSPFSVGDRAKMAMATGVPKENIIAINQPYKAEEYIKYIQDKGLDPQDFALVFAVSKKDMEGVPEMGIPPDPRFTFKPKRDGSPSYLQPYSGNENKLQNILQHAYVISTDVEEFPIAGETMRDASAIRTAYKTVNDDKRKEILHDMYGKAARHIKPIFDRELLQDAPTLKEFYQRIKPLLKEASPLKRLQIMKRMMEARSSEEFMRQMRKILATPQTFEVGDWVIIDPNGTSGYASRGMIGRIAELYTDDAGESVAKIFVSGSSGVQTKMKTRGGVLGPSGTTIGLGKGVRTSGTHTQVPISMLQKYNPNSLTEASSPAQQAAIAVAMKRAHKKPKKVKESVVDYLDETAQSK